MLRIGSYFQQRIGRGAEQNIVNDSLVLPGDARHGIRQREHHVKVFYGQQLTAPGLQPSGPRRGLAFRTMAIAAGVVNYVAVRAMITDRRMSSQLRGATGGEALEDVLLPIRYRSLLEQFSSVLPDDVGDFESRDARGGS